MATNMTYSFLPKYIKKSIEKLYFNYSLNLLDQVILFPSIDCIYLEIDIFFSKINIFFKKLIHFSKINYFYFFKNLYLSFDWFSGYLATFALKNTSHLGYF